MKKIDLLMQELGFNKNAPDSVKEAFIKHLMKVSVGVNVMTPSEKKEIASNPQRVVKFQVPQQLSFDFLGDASATKGKKKAVS